MLTLEISKQIVKNVYPIVLSNRSKIFQEEVSVAALQDYFGLDHAFSVYAAATIIYQLEAEGYVSKPLKRNEYKRILLK
ncbi:hypothetical protein ABDI02_12800 [Priestia megaterium]